jgi:peptidyl-prolyl cis-trans isomerase C
MSTSEPLPQRPAADAFSPDSGAFMKPHQILRNCILSAVLTTPFILNAALAQDNVVARVGDKAITTEDVALAEADFGQQLAQVDPSRRQSLLINMLVDMELLANAAREAGLDQSDTFKHRLEYLRSRALRNAYVEEKFLNSITDEEIEAEYQEQIKNFEPTEEARARHILVASKEEAEAIIKELDSGTDFATLARQKSTGPSGPNGGDLGYFGKGRMVPEFEQAAFALEKGGYSKEPVQTQFGWHVIMLEDKRMTSPPPVAEVSDQIRQVVMRNKYEALMEDLKAKTPVEVVDKPAE